MDKDQPTSASIEDHSRAAQAAEWLLDLRDGEPTAERLNQWLDWRGEDSRNVEAFDQAREFAGRIAASDRHALAGLIEEFGKPTAALSQHQRKWAWGSVMAASVAALVATALWLVPQSSDTSSSEVLAFSTPVATNRAIALPDGSEITLGAASAVQTQFDQDARQIELRDGEAFFKVKHEDKRAFYVRAGKLTVRAVGTAFDVRKTGDRITVTVTEGKVRVMQDDDANAVEVAAGEQVAYIPAATGLRVAKVDPSNVTSWREDRLEFINEPLDSVIANINRYSKRQLRIADPAIGRLTFTGTVSLQSLDRWLTGLQISFPVQIESQANGVLISYR